MNNKVQSINNSRISLTSKMETAGGILKKERRKQKKRLETISLDTKIDVKKLKAIEENSFDTFDSTVATKGFVKIYSEYLGLNAEKILAIYRRDFGIKNEIYKPESKKIKEEEKTFVIKNIVFFIPLLIILGIITYLYLQFSNFQNPPELEILEPENYTTVEKEYITIAGKTDSDAIVEIGNSKVPVNENGEFTTNVSLKQGDNTLTIRATSSRNPSREVMEIIYITYEEEEEEYEGTEEEEVLDQISLEVTVENNPTWVEIIIDDQLVVSQVLQVGEVKNYIAERNVSVNTGIRENTKVKINDEARGLSAENFSIHCELIDKELECK